MVQACPCTQGYRWCAAWTRTRCLPLDSTAVSTYHYILFVIRVVVVVAVMKTLGVRRGQMLRQHLPRPAILHDNAWNNDHKHVNVSKNQAFPYRDVHKTCASPSIIPTHLKHSAGAQVLYIFSEELLLTAQSSLSLCPSLRPLRINVSHVLEGDKTGTNVTADATVVYCTRGVLCCQQNIDILLITYRYIQHINMIEMVVVFPMLPLSTASHN